MKRWVLLAALAAGCGQETGLLEARSVEPVLAPPIRYESTPVRGIVRRGGKPISNALVLIERDGTKGPVRSPITHRLAVKEERGKAPFVVIRVGDSVTIRNDDRQQHLLECVHRNSNRAMYLLAGSSGSFTPSTGLTTITCAHGDHFTLLAIDPELQTRTDENGRFEFADVSSGQVRVVVWDGARRYKAQRVRLGTSRAVELTFNTP